MKGVTRKYHEYEAAQTGNPHPNISTTWKTDCFEYLVAILFLKEVQLLEI